MNIFFDTEFTGLVPGTSLISMGFVTETGERFYAEFTDYDKSKVTYWINANVVSKLYLHWQGAPYEDYDRDTRTKKVRGDIAFVANEFYNWLRFITEDFNPDMRVQFISDVSHYDMTLLCNSIFLGAFNLPYHVNPACYDICQDIAQYLQSTKKEPKDLSSLMQEAFDISREELCKTLNDGVLPEGRKHNSLYDAEVIKMIYEGLNMLKIKSLAEVTQ